MLRARIDELLHWRRGSSEVRVYGVTDGARTRDSHEPLRRPLPRSWLAARYATALQGRQQDREDQQAPLHDSIGWQLRDRRQFAVGFHGAKVFQLFLPFADDISKHGLKFREGSEWFQLH